MKKWRRENKPLEMARMFKSGSSIDQICQHFHLERAVVEQMLRLYVYPGGR